MVDTAHKRVFGAAAALAGLGGLALIAVGWWLLDWQYPDQWSRFGDGTWWASVTARALGYLAFGKLGFKVALAAVIGILALVMTRGRSSQPHGAADQPQPHGAAELPQPPSTAERPQPPGPAEEPQSDGRPSRTPR